MGRSCCGLFSTIPCVSSETRSARDGVTGSFRAHSTRALDAEREFERLYRESYGLVYNYVRARMSDQDDAEDVVAEAYLRAARAFDTFDPARAKFSTWVTKIAVNCMNSHYRKVRLTVALEDAPAQVFARPDGQEELADRDLAMRLLNCLDPTERNLVAMKYREGYRNVDIAEALDMNPSTVSTVLARALSKMRAVAESGIRESASPSPR